MIYADYNATTPLSPAALKRMELAFANWGNPSSSHQVGRQAAEILEESRRIIGGKLDVPPTQIVFTSGASEANTSALLGAALAKGPSFRLLTSPVEHSSIKDTLPLLQSMGVEVEIVPVLPTGALDWAKFEELLQNFEPHLVSLMAANNETGVIFPVEAIAQACKKVGAMFHTDAVQALGKLSPENYLAADIISLSAHKIGGPKGSGALIVRSGIQLASTHFGGAQEIKRRGGTENTIGIAGFAGAMEELASESEIQKLSELRDRFEQHLLGHLSDVTIQGQSEKRIANTSNVRLKGIPSEVLLGALDLEGVCVSAGSACSSGSVSPSHVILAMGFTKAEAKECVRFSFGKQTTQEDIDNIARFVVQHAKRIYARRAERSC